MFTARATFILLFVFAFQLSTSAQLIKKKQKVKPTKLDRVLIFDHFNYETLDTVSRTLQEEYGISISYDLNYCRRRRLTYWFMNTPLSTAIEITTRDQGLTYEVVNDSFVKITRLLGYMIDDEVINQADEKTLYRSTAGAEKHTGPPVKKNFSLSGKVVDLLTGEPLPYAIVAIKGTTQGTTSNADGFFTLLNVPDDTVAIEASYMSYKTRQLYLSPSVEKDNFIIELLPAENTIDEVVMTANRDDVMRMNSEQLSLIKMSPKKLAELPNVGEKDVMRSFQLVPGVGAANESSAGLYIRMLQPLVSWC